MPQTGSEHDSEHARACSRFTKTHGKMFLKEPLTSKGYTALGVYGALNLSNGSVCGIPIALQLQLNILQEVLMSLLKSALYQPGS